MKTTRRAMLAGALVLPGALGMADWRWRHGHGTVLLYDPDLPQGVWRAASTQAWQHPARAIAGDRIRFARSVFEARPAVVRGVSRQADLVLIEDVAAEAGYARVALETDREALVWTIMPRLRAPN